MTTPINNSDSKRKLDESLALLNSLFAHPSKKQQLQSSESEGIPPVSQLKDSTVIPPEATALLAKQHAGLKKRVFLPPRPAVLDKLYKLAGSRPTLQDSIAASIAASAPTSRASALTESPSTATDEATAPSTWFDKPKLVNAVECAKRGWINKGDDRLECCGGCGGVVIVRVDQIEEKPSSSTDNSAQDTESSHPANDFDLDDTISDLDSEYGYSIYKFPVLSYSHARKEFVDRAKELEKMKDDPLTENIRHPLTGVRDDDDDDMSMDDDEETSFDTIQAHKWYCYWVDPEHNEKQQVGWRIFYRSLISGSSGQVSQSQTHSGQQEASSPSPAGARIE
ncbi:hypothetical protein BGZ90_007141, partial [Linnemannia elongata]